MYKLASQTIQFFDPDQERELVFAAQNGNIKARNDLSISLIPMVVRLVEQMVGAGHPQFEDYVQEGFLGNLVGISKFNLDKYENRYYSYGYWWIRNSIDSARALDHTWCSLIADKIDDLEDSPKSTSFINPSENYLDSATFYDYIIDTLDFIPPIILQQTDILDQFRVSGLACHFDLLDEMLKLVNGELNATARQVLKLYYQDDLTFREVADKLGYSQRWMMELRNQALVVLKNKVYCLSGR